MHTKLLLTASIALALAGNCFATVKDDYRHWTQCSVNGYC